MSLASRLIKAIFATEAGVLTAATSPAAADSSKKIATTEWAAFGFAISKASPGYIKFPTWLGGLIIQWGQVGSIAGNGNQTVTYPIPFPTQCLSVVATAGANNIGAPAISGVNASVANQTAFIAYNTSASLATQPGLYIAVGF